MSTPEVDTRSERRRALDEQLAPEPPLPPPELAPGERPRPLEEFLRPARRPVAVLGVVENGLVRPLDPQIKLPERSRVIIVTSEPG